MTFGRLGVATLTAATNATVYTAPANCVYADVSIAVLNGEAIDATIEIAIANADVPIGNEYVERGVIVPALGGTLERSGDFLSPGEKIVVKSSVASVVVRVHGKEITKI